MKLSTRGSQQIWHKFIFLASVLLWHIHTGDLGKQNL